MKTAGIILIIIGLLMVVIPSVSFTSEKKVLKVGELEVNKKEKKTYSWPTYVGGIAALAGIVMVVAGKKQS
ncbi:hypothetical protein [Pinibacter aurantiacus]|uniref:DUF3185 domain-containing protein n=1 Tax=Pinibacter aurantiacus TaxID=2851599 RepID=A0A9E2W2W9_9BACT|nr:hypothetical protein [Pinibacter aurantiacus]MBV4355563.1 hypothetical protein [Pinibacter aurantiacus]